MTEMAPLETAALAPAIRSRFVQNINGLRVHMLEAGFEARGRPLVLLLHGLPELSYSWRKVMLPLCAAGFHVVGPDLRGYGRTTRRPRLRNRAPRPTRRRDSRAPRRDPGRP